MNYTDIIKHFGGAANAGRALGICRQAVYKWQDGVPELRQYQLQRITDGKLSVDPSLLPRPRSAA